MYLVHAGGEDGALDAVTVENVCITAAAGNNIVQISTKRGGCRFHPFYDSRLPVQFHDGVIIYNSEI